MASIKLNMTDVIVLNMTDVIVPHMNQLSHLPLFIVGYCFLQAITCLSCPTTSKRLIIAVIEFEFSVHSIT